MTPGDLERSRRARQAAKALVLWQSLVLLGIAMVTVFAIWHLRRRSRVIRSKFRPQAHPADTTLEFDPAIDGHPGIDRNEPGP